MKIDATDENGITLRNAFPASQARLYPGGGVILAPTAPCNRGGDRTHIPPIPIGPRVPGVCKYATHGNVYAVHASGAYRQFGNTTCFGSPIDYWEFTITRNCTRFISTSCNWFGTDTTTPIPLSLVIFLIPNVAWSVAADLYTSPPNPNPPRADKPQGQHPDGQYDPMPYACRTVTGSPYSYTLTLDRCSVSRVP